MSLTGTIDRVEVITSAQRRRRWSAEEKAAIVQETYAPGLSVSLVARRHGIAPNQLFRWPGSTPRGHCRRWAPARRSCRVPNIGPCSARFANCTAARHKGVGKRDPARGAGSGAAKKRLLRAPSPTRDEGP